MKIKTTKGFTVYLFWIWNIKRANKHLKPGLPQNEKAVWRSDLNHLKMRILKITQTGPEWDQMGQKEKFHPVGSCKAWYLWLDNI